jgi:molecular chaperone GrpE
MNKDNPKRISYKSRYLEVQKEVEKLKEKVEELEKQLSASDREAEEYLDHLRRLKAEFENYKKRMVKERGQLINWAVEDLIKEFLPVLDDLERAINVAKSSQNFSSLLEGIQMVYNHFKNLLEKKGLQEIPAQGEEFDPNVHEAIMRIESDEHPDNIVVEEMRKGYMFKDRVLRPSMVKVNKRRSSKTPEEDRK